MTTSLFKSIHSVILEHIDMYATLISKEHGIDKDNLLKLWKQIELNPPSTSFNDTTAVEPPPPKKVVSVYVQFCNKHRAILKNKNPDMSFGDISKELGKMWRSLSKQEKDNYQVVVNVPKDTLLIPPRITMKKEEDHSKLPVTTLKKMCEDLNIKKSGNKTILLARLKEYKEKNVTTTPLPPPTHEVDDEELVFFENESAKESDISSDSSTSSFVIDDEAEDLDFDDAD